MGSAFLAPTTAVTLETHVVVLVFFPESLFQFLEAKRIPVLQMICNCVLIRSLVVLVRFLVRAVFCLISLVAPITPRTSREKKRKKEKLDETLVMLQSHNVLQTYLLYCYYDLTTL